MVIGLVGRCLHLLLQSHLADLHQVHKDTLPWELNKLLVELYTFVSTRFFLFHSVKITVLYLQLSRYMCTYINVCNILTSFPSHSD